MVSTDQPVSKCQDQYGISIWNIAEFSSRFHIFYIFYKQTGHQIWTRLENPVLRDESLKDPVVFPALDEHPAKTCENTVSISMRFFFGCIVNGETSNVIVGSNEHVTLYIISKLMGSELLNKPLTAYSNTDLVKV